MSSLKDGLTSTARSVADKAGAMFGGKSGEKKEAEAHNMPPTPEWDAQRGEGSRGPAGEKAASYERAGGDGGGAANFGDGGPGGMNNRNATSYSWDNPPPKPRNADSEDEADAPKEKTAEEMFGMDKEPSKKMLKKKAARAKEAGALHAAVASGDVVDARELLELGANVNEPKSEEDSTTPLLVAAAKGNVEMVKLLIKSGANLDAQDDCDNNALHVACSKGHVNVVSRLIKAGCDVETRAGNGATALHLAARKGHDDVVELLLDSDMQIESLDGKGATPLHAACSGGYEDVVGLLLKRGANTAAVDAKGKTPRQIANKKGHDDCAKLIKRAIKEEEANKEAARQLADERAKRAALKEEAEAKAALEAHGLHDLEPPPIEAAPTADAPADAPIEPTEAVADATNEDEEAKEASA